MKKLLVKLGGGVVIIIIAAAVALFMWFHTSRDYHHTTVGAWFPDDNTAGSDWSRNTTGRV